MSLLQQHIYLRTGVYDDILKVKTLKQADRLLNFINSVPKLPSNFDKKDSTAFPHHLKLYMLKAALKRKKKPLLDKAFNDSMIRFNLLRLPTPPKRK